MDALYGIGIKKLVLPASLKTIDGYSLLALWELEEIEMPDNVKEIGRSAFDYNEKLTTIILKLSQIIGL